MSHERNERLSQNCPDLYDYYKFFVLSVMQRLQRPSQQRQQKDPYSDGSSSAVKESSSRAFCPFRYLFIAIALSVPTAEYRLGGREFREGYDLALRFCW